MIDPDDDDHATGASPKTSLPLVDVISSIPIDSAIFTTYTLSLAWFEGHLLRSLERCGANRIVLLADPVGVDSSLQEVLVVDEHAFGSRGDSAAAREGAARPHDVPRRTPLARGHVHAAVLAAPLRR